jgi:GNAT superfamily N-acetyltransferase
VVRWRRWTAEGDETFTRHEDLTAYERWLNGGPWMDETTCAHHLKHLRASGAGLALVAEENGEVAAEAEAFVGEEPPPFGRNLNLSVLYTRRGHERRGLGSALMAELERRARLAACQVFMVSHAEASGFYQRHGLAHHSTWRRAGLASLASRTQYTAEPLAGHDAAAIVGWAMPVGRYQSARQEWESRRPGAEPNFAEWRSLRTARYILTVRRRPAVLVLDESPRERGWAEMHLWTLGPLLRQQVAAARDLAARLAFNGLLCFVAESSLPLLGRDMEMDGYKQEVWLKRL